jgi:ferredoxin
LVNMVSTFPTGQSLELICGFHPNPESGLPGSRNTVRTANCLAALGPSLYIALQGRGVKHISLRLDACAQCPEGLQYALPQIKAITTISPIVEPIEEPPAETIQREVHTYRGTAFSRRGLFRSLLGRNSDSADGNPPVTSERGRLVHSLETLLKEGESIGELLDRLPFFQASLKDTCNACMACARSCPSGAIRASISSGNRFKLEFAPGLCLDCKLCVSSCRMESIVREPLRTLSQFQELNFRTILEEDVSTCQRCKTPFRSNDPHQILCPPCTFRRRNPFGAIGSSHLKGR